MSDEIEIWKTRSFWLSVFTAAAIIAKVFGFDIDAEGWADVAVGLVPVVTLMLAYRERMRPTMNVVVKKRKPNA